MSIKQIELPSSCREELCRMTLLSRILSLFGICCLLASEVFAHESPVVDLRQLTDRHGMIILQGPWDFYWQKFVDPFDGTAIPDDRILAGIGWKKADSERSGQGYATYRLRIKGFEFHENGYEITLPYILSSYRLTLHPEQDPARIIRHHLGEPGETADTTAPMTLSQTLAFQPLGPDEVWIINIQMACFEHSNGGFRAAPLVAPGKELSRRWRRGMDSDLFCVGILFIMFLYNLMLFIRRPEDKASLLGAFAILSIALRAVATSNMLYYLTDRPSKTILELNHIFEYTTLTGSGILFSYFLQLTFLPAAYPRLLKHVSILFSPLIIVTLLFPADIYSRFLPLYQISTAFFIGLGFWVVIRAWLMRLDGSLTVFLGGLCILASFIYDVLVIYGVLPRPFTLQYAATLYVFLASETLAQQFAKAFRTAERLQKELKQEVFKQTAEIKQIMASIPQGIFTMGARLCIEGQYSQHLEFILQTDDLEGREALPLLFNHSNVNTEQVSMLRSALLTSIGEDLLVWEFNQHCLIHEFQVQNPTLGLRIFELDWHPIANARATIDHVLVTLRDVTDWRKLQEANRQREEELNLLLELVPIPEGRWRDFVKQSHQLLAKAENTGQLAPTETSAHRLAAIALHTLKGLARSVGCRHLSMAVHEVEEGQRTFAGNEDAPLPTLMKSLADLRQLLSRYEALWVNKLKRGQENTEHSDSQAALLEELAYRRQQLTRTSPISQHLPELLHTLDSYIQQSLYVSLFALLRETTESMAQLATELNRIPPDIRLEGTDQWVHRSVAKVLRMSLVHLIRNALDHGLESPSDRQKQGKNPRGMISWRVSADARNVCITFHDDGRGLDIAALSRKANDLGYSQSDLEAMPHGVTDAMFISGLSSRDRVSEVSGRGVGMDALRSMVEEIGGHVWAQFMDAEETRDQCRPFETIIEIPSHLFLLMNEIPRVSVGF
jgi:HPt (histidine-containing phosphotransfer) domain-containing protein